ncbi:MAG: hypothetical protein UD961_00975, partial [Bacteroidales bacterium]|nr:hypothetical protein [Bacteroidales bacterium]
MKSMVVLLKKICFVFFLSFGLYPGFSQTYNRFDINYDSFGYTEEYQEKIEYYKNAYSFYKTTIDQILADEKLEQETAMVEMRNKNYAEVAAEKERLQKEYVEKFKSDYESYLAEKNKELELEYEQKVRDSLTAEYEEKKNAEVAAEKERLQKEYVEK